MSDYPAPPAPAVPPAYQPAYAPPTETNTLAVISLVSGIATWVILPLIGAIAAVITGHMALSEIRGNPGRYSGDGLAIAGLVLGYLQLGVGVCGLCAFLGLAAIGSAGRGYDSIVIGLLTALR